MENKDQFISISDSLPDKGKDIIGLDDEGNIIYCFRCACKRPECKEWRCTITGSGLMVNVIKWKYNER